MHVLLVTIRHLGDGSPRLLSRDTDQEAIGTLVCNWLGGPDNIKALHFVS